LESGACGGAWGDYNNDGYQDIYICYGDYTAMLNILYKNEFHLSLMDKCFKNVANTSGVKSLGTNSGVSFGDYDNDGHLDLAVMDSYSNDSRLYRNQGNGQFHDVVDSAGLGDFQGGKCAWADVDNDGYLDLYIGRSRPEHQGILFMNNGDGTFRDATAASNTGVPCSCGGIAFGDYDNDGDQDLYIANGTSNWLTRNVLFENDGSGIFTDVALEAGVGGDEKYYSSASWGDYNNDGYLDLFLTNLSIFGTTYRNSLYKNNGDGTFSNVTSGAGIGIVSSNSATWGDYDNDGYLDIYVSTRMLSVDHLYHNNGDGTFTEVINQSGIDPNISGNMTCSAWADYTRDGFLDLYMVTFYSPDSCKNKLYKNSGNENNWLVVTLEGIVSNRSGIGARVSVIADSLFTMQEVSGGQGDYQNSLPLEFGIGAMDKVDSLIIKWPSGIIDVYTDISPNQYMVCIENQGSDTGIGKDETDFILPDSPILSQNYPNPFNAQTTISFTLPSTMPVTLQILNTKGQIVLILVNEVRDAGNHSIVWDGRDRRGDELSSGMYLYRLITPDFHKSKTLTILR
jgi:hypothetical protein